MMEESEKANVVLRDLNNRLKSFLDHVAQLQTINHQLQEKIVTWMIPLERDWTKKEKTVEELRSQICHMIIENAELALRTNQVQCSASQLQIRCELEERKRLSLEEQVCELKQKKMNVQLANNMLEKHLKDSKQELHIIQQQHERELHVQQQKLQQEEAEVSDDGKGMELWHFGPGHGHLSSAALANHVPGFRPTSHSQIEAQKPGTNEEGEPPQVKRGDEDLREARAELAEVRKRWHSLQVEMESLQAVEQSLQSSLQHTRHQYSLQLRDLSQSVSELEAELLGIRGGLADQKHQHSRLLNTKMRLEQEIATYRRLLEYEEGRYFSMHGKVQKLKPQRSITQKNWMRHGIEKDIYQTNIEKKPASEVPVLHGGRSLIILTEPLESKHGVISTVKTKEIVEGLVVQEGAEGHGRVETEKIDKVIKQWEGSFFKGNPKLRKKSVSLRFDLHMAVADEGCAQNSQDSLPDVEVRLVMKRSRSIPTITQ